VEDAVPEIEQRLGILVRQVRHEVAEQDREEDQAEHLPFRSRFHDIRRDHALEYFGDVTNTLALNPGGYVGCVRLECEQVPGWLAVRNTATPTIIDDVISGTMIIFKALRNNEPM
jgi:hypothetical protein